MAANGIAREAADRDMHELIGKTLGSYNILEQVGRGGTAGVYKALDLNTGQTVAVKVLMPQLMLEEKFKKRFRREAKVLRGCRHPNIVPVLDYGEANGLVYLVMHFMKVGTLSDRLESGEFRAQEGARIMDQIAKALQYAHDAGVVHRDVKPSNILIDEDGNAWLSDFGFAHISDASMSLTGSALIGTPAYISPELVTGDKITPFSDQYSLAVVLYLMSTGTLPYNAGTPLAIAIKHATDPLPRPQMVNPNLPDAVEAVLIKALAKDPAHRFASVAEFNAAFQNAIKEALDPASGLLKPGAVGQIDITLPLDSIELNKEKESKALWFAGRSKWVFLLLFLLLFPLCWGVYYFGLSPASSDDLGVQIAQISPIMNLSATVNALSTANTPKEGTVVSPQEVETAVAATLTAMVTATDIPADSGTSLPTNADTTITLIADPSMTAGVDPSPTWAPLGMTTATSGVGSSPTRTPPGMVMVTQSVSPTPTRTPPGMPTFTPTRTSTLTPTLTFTLTPTRTRTPTLTKTPTLAIDCGDIQLQNFNVNGQKVSWRINNTTGTTITITEIYLDWPSGHDLLDKIELSGDAIWDQKDTSPATNITSGWKSGVSRSIVHGSPETLMFQFGDEEAGACYSLEVTFDVGCTRNSFRCDD